MRRMYPLLIAALLALLLAGCGAKTDSAGTVVVPSSLPSADSSFGIEPTVKSSSEASATPSDRTPSDSKSTDSPDDAELKDVAQEVVELLRERDLGSLVQWIDPELGLRFSPYSHMNPDSDLVFKPDTLPTFKDAKKLKWGTADGSGEPIELSFREYYEKFVYDKDYGDAPNVSVNKILGTGNVEFNGTEVYPNASYVEFHYPGFDEKLEGMDWESLILVFVPSQNDRKLVAIVHGQWTI
ncbi:hypothetical protein [Cohnella luojiensis]|uniref:DUF4309 domain-containing protein n=1 Tax=Cohnella luojiensis TaxID=652876 RepID=A0A4Y8M1D0_9BACL|nr:hypothetical protein [Cohnella luojiensis]TFE28933.1 hypothetical protein E2980_05940 [Cohnella luojiensis]